MRNCVPTSWSPPCGVENSSAGVAGSTTLVSVTANASPSERPLTVWVAPMPVPDGADGDGLDGGLAGAGALRGGAGDACGAREGGDDCVADGAGVAEEGLAGVVD